MIPAARSPKPVALRSASEHVVVRISEPCRGTDFDQRAIRLAVPIAIDPPNGRWCDPSSGFERAHASIVMISSRLLA
jgi:hypothetical protein